MPSSHQSRGETSQYRGVDLEIDKQIKLSHLSELYLFGQIINVAHQCMVYCHHISLCDDRMIARN